MSRDFVTKEPIIAIQTGQLVLWEKVLKPKVFQALKEWATATNEEVTDPFKIRRGNTLTDFIENYKQTI